MKKIDNRKAISNLALSGIRANISCHTYHASFFFTVYSGWKYDEGIAACHDEAGGRQCTCGS